jgi:hypothetical protein
MGAIVRGVSVNRSKPSLAKRIQPGGCLWVKQRKERRKKLALPRLSTIKAVENSKEGDGARGPGGGPEKKESGTRHTT